MPVLRALSRLLLLGFAVDLQFWQLPDFGNFLVPLPPGPQLGFQTGYIVRSQVIPVRSRGLRCDVGDHRGPPTSRFCSLGWESRRIPLPPPHASQDIPTGPRPRALFAWMGRDWRGFVPSKGGRVMPYLWRRRPRRARIFGFAFSG